MRQKWLQKPPLGTPINWSHASAKGLVLDLEFQEGGGDVVNDLSGNANHGILKNMAFPPTAVSGWNAGQRGAGLRFDGSDDYIDCGNDSSLISSDGTIAFWIKTTDDDDGVVYSIGGTSTNNWFAIQLGANSTASLTNELITIVRNNLGDDNRIGYCTTSRNELFDGNWHHIAITGDTEYKIYLDGVSKTLSIGGGSNNGNWTNITSPTYGRIGELFVNGHYYYFNGQIDQVHVYNRALSAAEIIDSYLNPFGRFERTKWGLLVPTAPPAGLSIPVAMYNYRRLRCHI